MNEAETRAEYIDSKIKTSGWGIVEGIKILRELRKVLRTLLDEIPQRPVRRKK